MTTRILQLNSLQEFQTEIPLPPSPCHPELVEGPAPSPSAPILRLSLTESSRPGNSLPTKDLNLDLMGVNDAGEIVWLHHSKAVMFTAEGPAFGRDATIYAGMQTMYDLVLAHLTHLGYQVRGRRYAIPTDLRPLRAHFECVRWEKDNDDSYRVTAAETDTH